MKLRLPNKLQAALVAALASVSFTTVSTGSAYGAELNQVITMSEMVTESTIHGATASTTWVMPDNGTVYNFSGTNCIYGIDDADLLAALYSAATSSSTYVTVAAWINPTGHGGSIFGYGGQTNGIKLMDNGGALKATTKGVSDFNSSPSGVDLNQWQLVALTFRKSEDSSKLEFYYMLDNEYTSVISPTGGDGSMTTASPATFSIGTGNSDGSRENFNGAIGGLTVFTSDGMVTADQVISQMGTAPKALVHYGQPGMTGPKFYWSTDHWVNSSGTQVNKPTRDSNKGPVMIVHDSGTATNSAGTENTSDYGGIKVTGNSNFTTNLGAWAGYIHVGEGSALSVSYSTDLKSLVGNNEASVYVEGTLAITGRTTLSMNDGSSDQNWYIGEKGFINLSGITQVTKNHGWNIQVAVEELPVIDITEYTNRQVGAVTRQFMSTGADLTGSVTSWKVFMGDKELTAGTETADNYTISYGNGGLNVTYGYGATIEKMALSWKGGEGVWAEKDSTMWQNDGKATSFVNGDDVVFGSGGNTANVSGNLTVGSLTMENGASLTIQGGAVTVQNAMALPGSNPSIHVKDGGVLTISNASTINGKKLYDPSKDDREAYGDAFSKLLTSSAVEVQSGGTLVVAGDICAVEQRDNETSYNQGVAALEIHGSLKLNAWSRTTYNVGANSLKVTGDAWFTNKQDVTVAGGTFEASRLLLGHNQNTGDYPAKLTATGNSKVILGGIGLYGPNNSVSITGGDLTFNAADASANVLAQAGGTGNNNIVKLDGVTLHSGTNGWTLAPITGATVTVTGTTTLDVATGQAINLTASSINGSFAMSGGGVANIHGSGTLTSTITVDSSTLTLDGTYAIDGLAPDPDSDVTFINAQGEEDKDGSGYRKVAGTTSVYTTTGDGASVTWSDATKFTVKGDEVEVDEYGKYHFDSTTDFTTLWVNNGQTVDYASYKNGEHGDTLSTVRMQAGGTLTLVNGDTVGTLQMDGSGSTTNETDTTATIQGLAGSGALEKLGGGKLVLSGDNTGYTGNLTVSAGVLETTNANSLGSGTHTVNEGGTIRIATRNSGTGLPTSLSVEGDGNLSLMTDKAGSGDEPANIDLKTVSAKNLYLHAEGGDANGYNSRFIYKSGSNLDGVEHLFFDGAQMWVQANMDFTHAVTFGATTYYESAAAFNKAALRVGNGNAPVAKFSGPIEIRNTFKAGWQGDGELVFAGAVTGTAAIDLASFSGNGKFTVSGDASGYTGAITADEKVTVEVASGGSLNIGSSSTVNGALTVSAGTLNVNADLAVKGGGNGQGNPARKNGLSIQNNGTININSGVTNVSGATYLGSSCTNGTFNVGDGTGEAGSAKLVTRRVEFGDSQSGTSSLNIKSDGILIVTSDNDTNGSTGAYQTTGLIVSEWGNSTTVNAAGSLFAPNVSLYAGDQPMQLNIQNGGVVAVKGIGAAFATNEKDNSRVTLENGGRLVLGSNGIPNSNKTWAITLNSGEIGMTADTTLARAITLGGAANFNTTKYAWSGEGASLALNAGTEGGTMTVSGSLSGTGSLTTTGLGTLELTGTNSYTGGTTVNGGTLKAASLGSGNVALSAGTLEFTNTSAITVGDFSLASGTVKFAGAGLLEASTLSAANGVVFDLSGLSARPGEYILATATTTGGAGDLTGVVVDWALPSHLRQELSVKDNAWVVTLTSNGQDLTWTGAESANWNDSEENWQDASGAPSVFSSADRAVFTAAATANVVGEISAAGVLVQNGANVSLATANAGSLSTTDLEINGTLNTALDMTVADVEATGAGATWNITGGTATAQSLAVADSADLTIKLSGGQLTGATQLHGNATLTAAQTTTLESTFSANLNGHTLTVGADADATLTVQGVLSGEGSALVKTGEGTVVLRGANTYTGTTTVDGGTLAIAAQAPIGTVVINENGTLRMDKGYTFTGTVSGAGKMTYAGATAATLDFGSLDISQWTGSFDNESSAAVTLNITRGDGRVNAAIGSADGGVVNITSANDVFFDNVVYIQDMTHNNSHTTFVETNVGTGHSGIITATGHVTTGRLVVGKTTNDAGSMFILSGDEAYLANGTTEHTYGARVQGYGTFKLEGGATQSLTGNMLDDGNNKGFYGTFWADGAGSSLYIDTANIYGDQVTFMATNGGQIVLSSSVEVKETAVDNGTFELNAAVETLNVSGENNTLNIGTGSVGNISLGGDLKVAGELDNFYIHSGTTGTVVTADAGKKLVVDGTAHVDARVEFHSSDTQKVEIAATRVAEQERYALESDHFDVTAATVEKVAAGDVAIANKVSAATVENNVAEDNGKLSLTTGVDLEALKNVIAASGDIEFLNVDPETQATLDNLTIAHNNTVSFSTDGSIGDVATEATVTVAGTLTAGTGATLNANLVMDGGEDSPAVLDVHAMGGIGGLNMGSDVTLVQGRVALSQEDIDAVTNLQFKDKYDLFNGVEDFYVGDLHYGDTDVWVNAKDVFTNDFGEKDYYLFYSGANQGGVGGNVGTIYIMQMPEPTTGTLSLLALAALAARRRRR